MPQHKKGKIRSRFLRSIGSLVWMCVSLVEAYGQSPDSQFWMDYNYAIATEKKLSYVGDIGLRGLFSNVEWNQLYFRPGVQYRFDPTVNVAGSIATFNTFFELDENIHEFRVTEDVNVSWPRLELLSLSYRFRLEQRFFYYKQRSDDFNLRLRLLLGLRTKDLSILRERRALYLQTLFEGFNTPAADTAFEVFVNQTRLHAIVGYKITKEVRFEVQYIWQRSRLFREGGLQTTQNILRLRLFHRFGK